MKNREPVAADFATGFPEEAPPRPEPWEWALLVQILILTCVIRSLWVGFDLDDSFITYTYSRSLAEGQGFLFAGQKALGTTTPLYALLLGALNLLGLPLVETAKAIGLAAALGGGVLLWVLGRSTLGVWAGLGAAALLAINARHAAVSMSGMETSLYTAVCLGAFCSFHFHRPYWTAALCSAACLLRPDGVLLVAVLAVSHLATYRKLEWGPLACFLLPLALWIGYAFAEFGSPIPTSVTAKMAYPEYGPFKLETAARVLGSPLTIPLTAVGACGLVFAITQERTLLPLACWTLLYLGAFLKAPNFPWYYVPPIPGIVLLAIAGLVALFRTLMPWDGNGWAALRSVAGLGLAVAVGWFTVQDTREYRVWLSRVYGPEVTGAYHSLALWLRDNTLEDATIAAPEVGYVGFYSERRVLDLVGLCSPQVIPYLPARRYVDIVRDFQPDYVALTTESGRPVHNTISESKWFRAHYTARAKFPYRSRWYVVYQRLSRPIPPSAVSRITTATPAEAR